jgi:antibiotic biosynthesis monooxygenase (ABM) superfamily enzyme
MKIVVTFNRPNSSHKFFYEEYDQHPVVMALYSNFESYPGFLKKEILLETETTAEVAMSFNTLEDFLNFSKDNKNLLDQRKALIEEWCQQTGHTFNHQLIIDESTRIDIP